MSYTRPAIRHWTASTVVSSRLGRLREFAVRPLIPPQRFLPQPEWHRVCGSFPTTVRSADCRTPVAVSEYGWRAINIEDTTGRVTEMYMTIRCCCCGGGCKGRRSGFYYRNHLVVGRQSVRHHIIPLGLLLSLTSDNGKQSRPLLIIVFIVNILVVHTLSLVSDGMTRYPTQ